MSGAAYIDRNLGTIRRPSGTGGLPKPIPASIQGWMWPKELQWLYGEATRLKERGVAGGILEVGSYKGLSASALGQAGELTCVDTFQGGEDLPNRDSRPEFDEAMRIMDLHPRVLVGRSEDILGDLYREAERFRFILIDGSHEYANVKCDLMLGFSLLSMGGVLVADDYIGFPGVKDACDEFGGFQPVDPNWSKMAWIRRYS